jgi:hypothetical protein
MKERQGFRCFMFKDGAFRLFQRLGVHILDSPNTRFHLMYESGLVLEQLERLLARKVGRRFPDSGSAFFFFSGWFLYRGQSLRKRYNGAAGDGSVKLQ